MSDHMSPLVNASGFAAHVSVWTEWGACRVHDLHTLTQRRARAEHDHCSAIEQTVELHNRKLADADRAHAEALALLKGVDTTALQSAFEATRRALVEQHAADIAQAEQRAASEIAAVMPRCRTGEGAQTKLDAVVQESEQTLDFVDVTIAVVPLNPLDGKGPTEHRVKLRCTPDVLFVTESGDVRADQLVGEKIRRVHADGTFDTYHVTEVVPVELHSPATVYAACVSGSTCVCVGVDGSIAALVRCRAA